MPVIIRDASEHINLKVKGVDNIIHQFKMKRHTSLRKLMNIYCERANLPRETVKFIYHGIEIYSVNSPLSLELEDGAIIEAHNK